RRHATVPHRHPPAMVPVAQRRPTARGRHGASALGFATRGWGSRVLDPLRRFALEGVAARQQALLTRGDQRAASEAGQASMGIAAGLFARHPECGIEAAQIESPGMAAQRLAAMLVEVFVEVGHCQLAQAAIDRVAVTELRTIALRYRTPARAAAE